MDVTKTLFVFFCPIVPLIGRKIDYILYIKNLFSSFGGILGFLPLHFEFTHAIVKRTREISEIQGLHRRALNLTKNFAPSMTLNTKLQNSSNHAKANPPTDTL